MVDDYNDTMGDVNHTDQNLVFYHPEEIREKVLQKKYLFIYSINAFGILMSYIRKIEVSQ